MATTVLPPGTPNQRSATPGSVTCQVHLRSIQRVHFQFPTNAFSMWQPGAFQTLQFLQSFFNLGKPRPVNCAPGMHELTTSCQDTKGTLLRTCHMERRRWRQVSLTGGHKTNKNVGQSCRTIALRYLKLCRWKKTRQGGQGAPLCTMFIVRISLCVPAKLASASAQLFACRKTLAAATCQNLKELSLLNSKNCRKLDSLEVWWIH